MSFIAAAILGAGALGVAGSIYSSTQQSKAAQSAASAQEQAAQTAANTQLGIFNKTQENLAPYNQAGQGALSQLASLFGLNTGGPSASTAAGATSALANYPGFQFGMQQGQQSLDRSAASQGTLLSGGQLKAAQQYGQGYAMQNAWNPYVSQLSSISGLGENAAASAGNNGVQSGAQIGNSQLAVGQAQASGIVGSANAITGGINGSINTGLNSALTALQLQNNQQNAINSGQTMGVSNGGYNYIDAQAGTGFP